MTQFEGAYMYHICCCPLPPVGTVKKCALLKIIHEKYHVSTSSRKMTEAEVSEFYDDMHTVAAENKDLAPYVGKAQEILNPLRVLHLFEHIQEEVCVCVCVFVCL